MICSLFLFRIAAKTSAMARGMTPAFSGSLLPVNSVEYPANHPQARSSGFC